MNIICIANVYEPKVRAEECQLWTSSVGDNATGAVICNDANGSIIYEQLLNDTDLPQPGIKLYFCNSKRLLPTEH